MKNQNLQRLKLYLQLKQSETGTRVAEICKEMGISEPTFYNWKKKYGGIGDSELRRL